MPIKVVKGEFTGIYREDRMIADDPQGMAEYAKLKHRRFDLIRLLGGMEEVALEVFAGNSTRTDWAPRLPDGAEPIAKDAREVLWEIRFLRELSEKADPKNAVLSAIRLGRAYERMLVRLSEPHALRGREVRAGGPKGHEKTHGTPAEKKRRWDKYQSLANVIWKKNPHLGLRRIAAILRSKYGIQVSDRTVQRRVKKPQSSL